MRSTLLPVWALSIAVVACSGPAPASGDHADASPPDAVGDAPATAHGEQQHMAHRFEDAARYAESFDDPARDAWQLPDRVVAALGIRDGQSVADVGAGTGYFTVRLAAVTGGPVYAVDIEQSMVDWIRDRAAEAGLGNVVPVLAGADRTNLPEPVDLALIVDTYHHIPARVAYFERLREDLNPGGRLAIVDFTKESPSGPPVEFRFTPEQISDEVGRAGFTLVAQHDFLPRQMFLVYEAS